MMLKEPSAEEIRDIENKVVDAQIELRLAEDLLKATQNRFMYIATEQKKWRGTRVNTAKECGFSEDDAVTLEKLRADIREKEKTLAKLEVTLHFKKNQLAIWKTTNYRISRGI